jgi:integrase
VRGSGTVVQDNRSKAWMFLWWEDGKRKSKSLGRHPNRTSAWRSSKPYRDALESRPEQVKPFLPVTESETKSVPRSEAQHETKDVPTLTVKTLVEGYRAEKMPRRASTRSGYNSWLDNHILPVWGEHVISDVQARPVELWLKSLELSPKSRSHIRGLLNTLWDFAMWRGDVPVQRNPMELVTIKGCTKRSRKPRSLTVAEFHLFIEQMREPFRTIALLCVCFGLRISEALALKWRDVDWLNGRLNVERGIVRQIVDDAKTENSESVMHIGPELLAVLKTWKQTTQFSDLEDWMFASPAQIGRLPWSYKQAWRAYMNASRKAGIGHISTHTMRHTYRAWLDAAGTKLSVQQKLMRHADIRTTMNTYGDVVTTETQEAASKVAGLALNGL